MRPGLIIPELLESIGDGSDDGSGVMLDEVMSAYGPDRIGVTFPAFCCTGLPLGEVVLVAL